MRIGIVGSGHIGGTLAKLWLNAGHEVRFGARDIGKTRATADPRAGVGSIADVGAWAEALFLAVPLKAAPDVARALGESARGKPVLDAGNAIPSRDGKDAQRAASIGSAAWLAEHMPGAHVVKAFNTVNFQVIAHAKERTPKVAVPLVGDDAAALAIAEQLVTDAGLEPVRVGPLSAGAKIDFGSPVWNSNMDAARLRQTLGL